MFTRSLATFAAVVTALAFSSIGHAASSWYCESGDPGGGGPTANIEIGDDGVYSLDVDYNRRNLNSSARSTTLNFEGAPISSAPVTVDGSDCIRSTLKMRGKRSIEFLVCEQDGYATIKLLNFTKQDPEYEMACQAN